FLAKLNPGVSGAASLVYSTYLGGSGADSGWAIAVDSAGIATVTGQTASSDFPKAASLRDFSGGTDAFVAQLNPALSGSAALLFSTSWGGSANDSGRGIAVDLFGNAFVTGVTESANFP